VTPLSWLLWRFVQNPRRPKTSSGSFNTNYNKSRPCTCTTKVFMLIVIIYIIKLNHWKCPFSFVHWLCTYRLLTYKLQAKHTFNHLIQNINAPSPFPKLSKSHTPYLPKGAIDLINEIDSNLDNVGYQHKS